MTPRAQKQHGYSRVVMVGDGATDLEARAPDAAAIFIG
jgi:soluble P-type ATPase